MIEKIIPSYAYVQYNDDNDILAFVQSYNDMSQEYLDWFRTINLPIYTSDTISDGLLDWVAYGLYGMLRPVLPAGNSKSLGPYNTLAYNTFQYNGYRLVGPSQFYATTDDVFKRIMTWNFYKGDGTTFNIRYLKRRIMRFLNGVNGTDPGVNQTYQISVTFGTGNQVNIRVLKGARTVTGGAIYNGNRSYNLAAYNELDSFFTQYSEFELAPILQAAISSGAVQLPFQFNYVVSV